MKKLAILMALTLTACVTSQNDEQRRMCFAYDGWLDRAQCLESTDRAYPPDYTDANLEEVYAYRRVLIEKVKSGKMSEAEADFALKQKTANAYDRYRQQEASRPAESSFYEQRQRARQEKPPTWDKTYVTKCNASNDLSGGVECRSQRDPRDAVLEKLANPN